MNTKNKEAEWFGYKKIKAKDKSGLVGDVFDSVADKYDLMNDLMSGGLHRVWKRQFVSMLHPSSNKSLLDVAGGTGDISFRYRKKASNKADITICDINKEMLEVGKRRALDRGYIDSFKWVHGDAQKLKFKDNSFDIYTISFGLRNVPKIDDALEEAYRVLKPGGQFFCMEFSKVKNPILDKIYKTYSFKVIPKIGKHVAYDEDSYQYLVESIQQFPNQENLAKRMKKAGFECVKHINLSGGIVAIHSGVKT